MNPSLGARTLKGTSARHPWLATVSRSLSERAVLFSRLV